VSYQKKPVLIRGAGSRAEQPNIALASAAFVVMAAVSHPVFAADTTKKTGEAADITQLEGVTAETTKATPGSNPNADPEAPYKIDKSANGKFTEPLLNVSKTINVVGKEQMKDAGVSALKDLMRTQPGITLGTGENGNQEGDRFLIRGFDAKGDTFVDSMREPGMTTRDIFASEQVEITKGPSSTFGGRGTTGGAINIVSKKAQDTNFARGTVTLGDDKRTTLDANRVVNDKLKVRTNIMVQDSDVAGRDEVFKKGHGVALAADYQATDKVNVKVDYYHLRGEGMPDRGQPYTAAVQGTPASIDRSNFYGYKDRDFWDTGADTLTAAVDVELSNNTRINSQTRVGETTNSYVVSNPASVRLDGTVRPGTSSADATNKFIGHNTQVSHEFHAGDVEHVVVAGVELTKEDIKNTPYTIASNASGAFDQNLQNPTITNGPAITGRGNTTVTDIKTQSVYLMDTVKLNPQWEVFGGLRHDTFDIKKQAREGIYDANSDPATKKSFTNGHLGFVYKPKDNGSIYASVSSSSNIPGEAVDSGAPAYGGINETTENAKPEKNKSFELGTKWNLANDNLSLNAAVFRTEKKNKIETTGGGAAAVMHQVGAVKVDGIEVGVSGNVTPKLSLSGGAVYMDTEITNSVNAANKGKKLANIAEKSASIQAKYQATPQLALGGTVVHTGKFKGGGNFEASDTRELPASNRLDLMAEYKINKKLSTQLNVKNATDKTIFEAVYPSGFTYIAPGRTTNVSLTYDF
jgi:catecholate siderophore receptor